MGGCVEWTQADSLVELFTDRSDDKDSVTEKESDYMSDWQEFFVLQSSGPPFVHAPQAGDLHRCWEKVAAFCEAEVMGTPELEGCDCEVQVFSMDDGASGWELVYSGTQWSNDNDNDDHANADLEGIGRTICAEAARALRVAWRTRCTPKRLAMRLMLRICH